MATKFESTINGILNIINEWEPILLGLDANTITTKRNAQNRNIKQIVGHMIDSASNNTHRIIHIQYQKSPFSFPNYATHGNNDRWIAIQNYENEDWNNLVKLWKYSNFHITHVIKNVDLETIDKQWIAGGGETCTLYDMIIDFPRHLKLHIDEIKDLIDS